MKVKSNLSNQFEFNGLKVENLCDLHTHTIFSMHGLSSPTEMIERAIECGYSYFGITDHYYDFTRDIERHPLITNVPIEDISTDMLMESNQQARIGLIRKCLVNNHLYDEIRVIPGYEYNFFQTPKFVKGDLPSLRILGLHDWYAPEGGYRTSEFIILDDIESKLATGMFNIFAHPSRTIGEVLKIRIKNPNTAYPTVSFTNSVIKRYLYCVVDMCRAYEVAVELNAQDSKDTFYFNMLVDICKDAHVDVIVNSDSHSKFDLGSSLLKPVFDILESK